MLLCLGWGLRPAQHRRLETVKDGTQACTQEGGKEREGGSVKLGKSEGGGGGEGGRRQWKNCEMCLAKSGPIFFKQIMKSKFTVSILRSWTIFTQCATHVLVHSYTGLF